MAAGIGASLSKALEPLAEEHGLEFVAVEVAGSPARPTVRVYLDRPGGIDMDAVADANKWVAPVVEELIPGSHTLEVSSPGIDRPLVKPADFERFLGDTAVVRTSTPVEGRSNFTGTIVAVDGDEIVLDVDGQEFRLSHSTVAKARLKATVDLG